MNKEEKSAGLRPKEKSSFQVFQIPALRDNYIYILHESLTGKTAVIDPSVAEPVEDFLKQKNLPLNFIFNTHHHWDHTGGNQDLKKNRACEIYALKDDAHRIPGTDKLLKPGEIFYFGKSRVEVLFVPGHTLGHIAFFFSEEKHLFCGDTLFAMGCGRLFEGTAEMMFQSLEKIKTLPEETQIYCGHEYTEDNARFALTVDPQNAKLKERARAVKSLRAQNKSTVPFSLKEELETNPFLRARTAREFQTLREKKDVF